MNPENTPPPTPAIAASTQQDDERRVRVLDRQRPSDQRDQHQHAAEPHESAGAQDRWQEHPHQPQRATGQTRHSRPTSRAAPSTGRSRSSSGPEPSADTRNHVAKARVRLKVVIHSVFQARPESQVSRDPPGSSCQASHRPRVSARWPLHSCVHSCRGLTRTLRAVFMFELVGQVGAGWCSIRTTVRCIHTAAIRVTRKSTPNVACGAPVQPVA